MSRPLRRLSIEVKVLFIHNEEEVRGEAGINVENQWFSEKPMLNESDARMAIIHLAPSLVSKAVEDGMDKYYKRVEGEERAFSVDIAGIFFRIVALNEVLPSL